jgi:hypothetical protein
MGFLDRIFGTNSKEPNVKQVKTLERTDRIELQTRANKAADKYFENLHKIEDVWKELKDSQFRSDKRDELWRLCIEGRRYFWDWITQERKIDPNYFVPPTVPCYKRAVMLLEHEERWETAIDICRQALEWIASDWYARKMEKLEKKVKHR